MICGMFIMTAHLPNMIMVGIFDKAGFSNLNYLNWMLLQAPYLGMFALTQAWIRWHFGTRKVHIAGGVEALQKKYDDLGPMTMPEKVLLGIFALAGIMFMTGKGSFIAELHHQPLGVIGLLGMLVLFAPGLMPCSWKSVQEKTIWGTFLLLGGAMTMTTAMTQSGLAQWLAQWGYARRVFPATAMESPAAAPSGRELWGCLGRLPLGLLGASPSAVALDEALCAVLGLPLAGTPLGAALERREAPGCRRAGWQPDYVLARPEDFDRTGFILPDELMHTSFRPWRLFKSCLRRLWLARRK